MKALLRRFLVRADENLDWGHRHLELAFPTRSTSPDVERVGTFPCCRVHCYLDCSALHRYPCARCAAA